jgi:hypothetical protein
MCFFIKNKNNILLSSSCLYNTLHQKRVQNVLHGSVVSIKENKFSYLCAMRMFVEILWMLRVHCLAQELFALILRDNHSLFSSILFFNYR